MKSIRLSKFASRIQIAAVGVLFIAGQFILGRQTSPPAVDLGSAYLTHGRTQELGTGHEGEYHAYHTTISIALQIRRIARIPSVQSA